MNAGDVQYSNISVFALVPCPSAIGLTRALASLPLFFSVCSKCEHIAVESEAVTAAAAATKWTTQITTSKREKKKPKLFSRDNKFAFSQFCGLMRIPPETLNFI